MQAETRSAPSPIRFTDILGTLERLAWRLRGLSDEAWAWQARGRRLSRAGATLARIVADYRAFAIYSAFLSDAARRRKLERLHRRSARAFHRISETQMGAFLKVGQLLSARPDLLPAPWIEALAPLQDAAPPLPLAEVARVVEEELGAPLAEHFTHFDDQPLAAASIGQVHRASTRDGHALAVKIQRPGVGALIEQDLALLRHFLGALEGLVPPADYDTIAGEIERTVRGELDYRAEAEAMRAAAAFFAADARVRVPCPVEALCRGRVLVASFEPGAKITVALEAADAAARADILGRLLAVYLRQIFEAGVFQADPHPGNFLVAPDGALVLLDFGCTVRLEEPRRLAWRALVGAFLRGDQARLARLFDELGFVTQSGRPDTLMAFAAAMLARFQRGAATGAFSWPTRAELLDEGAALAEAATRDPVTRLPADFIMIARVLGTLAGMFQHYRPAIDFARHVLPHLPLDHEPA